MIFKIQKTKPLDMIFIKNNFPKFFCQHFYPSKNLDRLHSTEYFFKFLISWNFRPGNILLARIEIAEKYLKWNFKATVNAFTLKNI